MSEGMSNSKKRQQTTGRCRRDQWNCATAVGNESGGDCGARESAAIPAEVHRSRSRGAGLRSDSRVAGRDDGAPQLRADEARRRYALRGDGRPEEPRSHRRNRSSAARAIERRPSPRKPPSKKLSSAATPPRAYSRTRPPGSAPTAWRWCARPSRAKRCWTSSG